ncbi:MAG: hypothetical protein ACI9QL_003792, partial [Candidatus Omnitrophota bacterium]
MLPFTRKILEDWAGKQIFRDGARIYEEGRVESVSYEQHKISGLISNNLRPIKCAAQMHPDGSAEPLCPCRLSREQGFICAHIVALCLEMLNIENDPERKAKLEAERRRADRLAAYDDSAYIQRVPKGTKGAIDASIKLQLPKNWMEGVADGKIPLRVFAVVGAEEGPIHLLPTDLRFCFNERDENLLFVLEDISEGPVKSELQVGMQDFMNLLAIASGKYISLAEGGEALVNTARMPAKLLLDLDRENGELILILDTPLPSLKAGEYPTYLVKGKQAWAYGGKEFWPLASTLPEPLHAIYLKPMFVERKAVPRFLKVELPALQQIVDIETELSEDLFSLEPEKPEVRLVVRGSPASLSAILYARYGELEFVANKPDPVGDFALPNPDDLMAYYVRNLPAERAALQRLYEVGLGGDVGDEMHAIVHQRNVMVFCGTHLPSLRRKGWKVELQGRITEFLDDVEYATPVVEVRQPSEGADWFEVGFEFDVGGESLSRADIQRAILKGESHVERKGKMVLFDSDAVRSMSAVFSDSASSEGSRGGSFRMSAINTAYVQSALDSLDGVDIEAPKTWLQTAEQQNRSMELEPVELQEPLKSTLRDYQNTGVSWLRFLETNHFCGILADEMGLGKTLQTLVWLQLKRVHKEAAGKPVLLVCPTSLVENWIDEAEKFTPHLKFLNLTGTGREKAYAQIDQVDVIVTSYAIMRRDIERLVAIEFAIVALDEAQHIKNRSTQNAVAAKKLVGHNRVVLTGTPVENSVADLWSIMDFLMPGYLGGHEHFRANYEVPIGHGGEPAEDAQRRLRKKLHPFLLRRLKKDVAKDLPPKIEKVTSCQLTKDQSLVYQELVKQSRKKLTDMVEAQGFAKSRMEVFKTLLRLRQVCCHLDLLKLPGLKAKAPSGKMDLFFELLQEAMDGGHRVLVFSQFTTMLGILREELKKREIRYCYLDGSTKHRMAEVREFNLNAEIPVFLISLKAGGTGLNLTGADMVIHYDPWWNPAVENQASDRAY